MISTHSALPLVTLNPRLDFNDPHLRQERPNPWNVGLNFLRLNNDDDRLFSWGRLPVLLALLLGYFVYRWASELYGGNAGLMALLLYAFCPTLVAFSGFASLHIGFSFFFTLSLYCLWRFMGEGTCRLFAWIASCILA